MQKSKIFFFFLLILWGCQIHCAFPETSLLPSIEFAQQNPHPWAKEIDKDANLYQVDTLLYRSMQLDKKHLYLLKSEGIDTALNLRYFNRNGDKKQFRDEGIELVNIPLKAWYIKPAHLAKALWEIEKRTKNNKTVLVHCKHGADRTGIVIAMYRVIDQGWTPEEAKDEMVNGPYNFHAVFDNLTKMLTDETVKEVKEELQKLREINTFEY